LREKDNLGCTITPRGFPWREIFNFNAATAGATLPSPLPISNSFRNAVIRPRNVASHAGPLERATRGAPATAPVRHREALWFVQVVGSLQPCLLNRVATGQFIAGTATRHAKEVVADREDGNSSDLCPDSSAEWMRRNRDAAMSHRNAPGICRWLSVDGFIFAARSPEIAGNLSLFPLMQG